MPSPIADHARAFVDEHLPRARGLGEALVGLIDEPDAFETALREGLSELADPAYASELERMAPDAGAHIPVRWPLWRAVARQLDGPLREASSAWAIALAQHLVASPVREVRLFAIVPLERSLPADPERSWQIVRRLAGRASDPLAVDAIADLAATGILLEGFRWAELEQLVYSDSPWERRLVGSTIARLPSQAPAHRRPELARLPALDLLGSLMGDADASVQKSLAWALREWTAVDRHAVTTFLTQHALRAAADDDGHRARVVRDALARQPAAVSDDLRHRLRDVRPRDDAPSTSDAAAAAAAFRGVLPRSAAVVDQQGDRMARIRR